MDKNAAEKASEDVSISRAVSKETTDSKNDIESIQLTEDLNLILLPRMKLDFICGCTSENCRLMMDELALQIFIASMFHSRKLFHISLNVPIKNVHVRALPRWKDDGMPVIAEGFLIYRDPIWMSRELYHKLRDFILEKLQPYKCRYYTGTCEYMVKLSLPPSEDPNIIMASVPSDEVPTLIIKGFPTHWFTDLSDSSQPSIKLLQLFFEKFGNVRDIHVDDVVSIQYEDRSYCYKALQSLCGCSLLKDGSHPDECVDYEFILNEKVSGVGKQGLGKKKRDLEDDLPLPPSKRPNTNPVKTKSENELKQHLKNKINETIKQVKMTFNDELKQQLKNTIDEELKQFKTKVEEEFKHFKTKVDEAIKQFKTKSDENNSYFAEAHNCLGS